MHAPPLRLPPPLEPGARIRVVSPCGVVDRSRLESGLEILRRRGLEPVWDDRLFANERSYLAGRDEQRWAQLREALDDDEAGAIWVARGGYGATRLLPFLRARHLRPRPRWLVGFSDATALHGAWHRAGVATLHGPNVSSLGWWGEGAVEATFDWMGGKTPPSLPGVLHEGREGVEAPLLGGNLALLTAMVGTGYLPSLRGCHVLLEDVGESPYRLDRTLTQLLQAGVLEGVCGYVVGQLSFPADEADATSRAEMREAALATVLERVGGQGVPVLAHVPVGHEQDAWPTPLGRIVRLEGDGLAFVSEPRSR